jgi:hypothetical protein
MQNTPFAAQQQQVNKFLEATRRLGAQMDKDQGTTRVIYDTTGSQTALRQFSFFENVSAKVYPATNISQNRFQPGEGMVIKEIYFFPITPLPIQNTGLALSTIDVFVGNNRVIKDLPLTSFSGRFAINNLNPTGTVQGNANRNGVAVRLRTNIVIPPQIEFKVTLKLSGPIGTEQAPINLKCMIKGYGKLFNPGQNY